MKPRRFHGLKRPVSFPRLPNPPLLFPSLLFFLCLFLPSIHCFLGRGRVVMMAVMVVVMAVVMAGIDLTELN